MAYTQVSSEQSQPLFLRVNNRNAASRTLNAIRAENYAERTQQTSLQTKAQTQTQSGEQTTSSVSAPKPETDTFGFEDMLDMINPLHHIPVVSTLYQDLTGDTISAPAKIVGGGIFGGVTGLAGSLIDAIIEEVSGLDIGHHVLALFNGNEEQNQTPVQIASAPSTKHTPTFQIQADTEKHLRTPKNMGGIQLISRAANRDTPTTPSQAAPAQPELPEIKERIRDPKTAWSNRPNLSPAAFNALLASFEESTASTQAIAQQVAPKGGSEATGTKTRGVAKIIQTSALSFSKYAGSQTSTPINDLLSKMQTGLDKYDQAKNQALSQSSFRSLQ